MDFNIEIPEDEIELSDDILESEDVNWEELEKYLVKQLGLEDE